MTISIKFVATSNSRLVNRAMAEGYANRAPSSVIEESRFLHAPHGDFDTCQQQVLQPSGGCTQCACTGNGSSKQCQCSEAKADKLQVSRMNKTLITFLHAAGCARLPPAVTESTNTFIIAYQRSYYTAYLFIL